MRKKKFGGNLAPTTIARSHNKCGPDRAHVHSMGRPGVTSEARAAQMLRFPIESVFVNSHGTGRDSGSQVREDPTPPPSWNWSLLRQRRREEEEGSEGMAQPSKEPCKKEACDIQACLSKNMFDSRKYAPLCFPNPEEFD